jgi:hypothetical protein
MRFLTAVRSRAESPAGLKPRDIAELNNCSTLFASVHRRARSVVSRIGDADISPRISAPEIEGLLRSDFPHCCCIAVGNPEEHGADRSRAENVTSYSAAARNAQRSGLLLSNGSGSAPPRLLLAVAGSGVQQGVERSSSRGAHVVPSAARRGASGGPTRGRWTIRKSSSAAY